MRLAGIVLLSLLLAGCQSGISRLSCEPEDSVVVDAVLDERYLHLLAEAPSTNRVREERVVSYFREAGCPEIARRSIPLSHQQNVICSLPGKSASKIVIGAHFDKLGPGRGFADNWTGIVMASQLVAVLAKRDRRHTFEVIAFGEEEDEMRGARAYLFEARNSPVEAFINLDTIGLGPLVADPRSSDDLLCLARDIGERAGIDLEFRVVRVITGDWEPFHRAGVPVMNFHSLDRQSLRTLHSRRDRLENIAGERLDEAYRIVLSMVLSLDRGMDGQAENVPAKLSAQAP